MLGGGSPQTFSQGGNPAPYVPTAQPAADQTFQNIISGIYNQVGPTGAGSPAGTYYPAAQGIYTNLIDPFGTGVGGTAASQALRGSADAMSIGLPGVQPLESAGQNILQQSIDPQQALFHRLQQQTMDQSNAANATAGIGSSPYGASVTANALGNLDTNWQNQLLSRMIQGGAGATPLLQAAPALESQLTMMPYQTGANIGTGAQSALGNLVNLGNNQYLLPQQILNNLESYLQLGQSASNLGLTGGNLGFNQTAQGIGGLLSGANTLFGGGSGGLLSGLGGGSAGSGLGAGFVGGADFGGGGAALGVPDVLGGTAADLAGSGFASVPAATGAGIGSFLPFGLSG